jgi:hypothetical protein
MTMMEKIAPYVIFLGMGTLALNGCATSQMSNVAKIDEIKKALGVTRAQHIQLNLPDGYITSTFEDLRLRTIAGVYSETVELRRIGDECLPKGSYNEVLHPDAMRKVLREADTNGDKLITKQESMDLVKRVCEEYAK